MVVLVRYLFTRAEKNVTSIHNESAVSPFPKMPQVKQHPFHFAVAAAVFVVNDTLTLQGKGGAELLDTTEILACSSAVLERGMGSPALVDNSH